jgi:hypothetical protein
MATAERKTRTAGNLIIVTVVLGAIFVVLYIVLERVVAMTTSSANNYGYL